MIRPDLRLAGLAALLLGGCEPAVPERDAPPSRPAATVAADRPELGLFTTLPIYWGEGDFATLLEESGERDWVRAELEREFELVPLDTVEEDALAGLDRVLLAQPRALAPSENVALDSWIAQGGRAVILADPMATRHSSYAIGDRRRPQDVVLLSPILARWGLELRFDAAQPSGERMVAVPGGEVPVDLAGSFALGEDADPSIAECRISAGGLVAECERGKGRVTLYADAALLDWEGAGEAPEARRQALDLAVSPLAE